MPAFLQERRLSWLENNVTGSLFSENQTLAFVGLLRPDGLLSSGRFLVFDDTWLLKIETTIALVLSVQKSAFNLPLLQSKGNRLGSYEPLKQLKTQDATVALVALSNIYFNDAEDRLIKINVAKKQLLLYPPIRSFVFQADIGKLWDS
jgi:hypothetical protein